METRGAQFSFDLRKMFFSHEGGEALEQAMQRDCEAPSMGTFKAMLEGPLSNLDWWEVDEVGTRWSLETHPSQTIQGFNHFTTKSAQSGGALELLLLHSSQIHCITDSVQEELPESLDEHNATIALVPSRAFSLLGDHPSLCLHQTLLSCSLLFASLLNFSCCLDLSTNPSKMCTPLLVKVKSHSREGGSP